jgi:hypothetical protein
MARGSARCEAARDRGAWSVYPYLPSGTVLVSDTQSGLLILRIR